MLYFGAYLPLKVIIMNRVEMYNELSIQFISLHMLYFTDWVPEKEDQYYYGWWMIAAISTHIMVNQTLVTIKGFRPPWLYFTKFVLNPIILWWEFKFPDGLCMYLKVKINWYFVMIHPKH